MKEFLTAQEAFVKAEFPSSIDAPARSGSASRDPVEQVEVNQGT